MDLNLKNKVVVVTGGSKGIGFAVAKEFLAEGAEVFITGRNLESLKRAEEELKVYGKVQSAVKYMKDSGGSIVNISSLAARCATCGRSNIYASMKAALLALTKTSAGEYVEVTGGHNIVLNPWQSYEE